MSRGVIREAEEVVEKGGRTKGFAVVRAEEKMKSRGDACRKVWTVKDAERRFAAAIGLFRVCVGGACGCSVCW